MTAIDGSARQLAVGGGYGPPQGYGHAPGGHGGASGFQPQGGPYGQLQVQSSFFFAFWILYFIKPRISINGQVHIQRWGTSTFDLPAGEYQLEAFYPYFVLSKAGRATMTVQIHPGQCTVVKYSAPWFIFVWGGTLSMLGARPAGPPQLRA